MESSMNDLKFTSAGDYMADSGLFSVDQIIEQITYTLTDADVKFICDIANKVLHAGHSPAGEDVRGLGLILQTWKNN